MPLDSHLLFSFVILICHSHLSFWNSHLSFLFVFLICHAHLSFSFGIMIILFIYINTYAIYFILVDIYNKSLFFYLIVTYKYNNHICISNYFLSKTNFFIRKAIKNYFYLIYNKNHLKNICYNAHIYKGKTNMSKHDLIDMIITEKNIKNNRCTRRGWFVLGKAN